MVAVGEPTGKDDGVRRPEIGLGVPRQPRLPAEDRGGDVGEVALAPRAGEDGDGHARPMSEHGHGSAGGSPICSSERISQLAVSMTGLASSRRHMSATLASAAAWSSASKLMRM